MSRFDYIKYDGHAVLIQESAKSRVVAVEDFINSEIISPRAKALALTKLEEVYMWIGKGLRDDQIARYEVTQKES